MIFGYITWTEPQLTIAEEIALAERVRAQGTSPWTKEIFSDQLGQMLWMAFVLIAGVIWLAFTSPDSIKPVLLLGGCVYVCYFLTVVNAAWKQACWLRRIKKKHPPGSKPPEEKPMACPLCGGCGQMKVALGNESGVVFAPCNVCHGSGEFPPPMNPISNEPRR